MYSFGLIMWEILHEMVPFDGKLKDCTELVIKQNLRPAIAVDDQSDSEAAVAHSNQSAVCSLSLANLISRCWASEPSDRPRLDTVIEELTREVSFFKSAKFAHNTPHLLLDTEHQIEPFK